MANLVGMDGKAAADGVGGKSDMARCQQLAVDRCRNRTVGQLRDDHVIGAAGRTTRQRPAGKHAVRVWLVQQLHQ